MKSVKSLKSELKELTYQLGEAKSIKEIKKVKKNIAFIKTCLNYVSTKPDEKFIFSEIQRINNRIQKISDGFDYWKSLPRVNGL